MIKTRTSELETINLEFLKNPTLSNTILEYSDGKELRVAKDGCVLISLYNALRLCGYTKDFKEYCTELDNGECFDSKGQINWLNLNKLQLNLQFIWMQDNEIPNCEKVNLNRLKECELNSENIAIVKVQSLTGADRRHFMVLIEFVGKTATCLEIVGKIEMRSIPQDEILGVRYLKKKANSNFQ